MSFSSKSHLVQPRCPISSSSPRRLRTTCPAAPRQYEIRVTNSRRRYQISTSAPLVSAELVVRFRHFRHPESLVLSIIMTSSNFIREGKMTSPESICGH